MNVHEMSDLEKSVMLARLCGWSVTASGTVYIPDEVWETSWARRNYFHNLYAPQNMAVAWRIHIWAINNLPPDERAAYIEYWLDESYEDSPMWFEDAQRRWLDKILELAIDAGMVEKP